MKRVYFLRPIGQLGPIKIGCSVQPELRLDSLTIWSPVRLELICSVPGGHSDERTLHAMFDKHRVHGEWFGASKELLGLIDHCAATGELPALPKVLKFPTVRHVGYRGRASGKSEPRALKGAKLELATRVRAQYESGMPGAAVAADNGISLATVFKYVRQTGGTVRSKGEIGRSVAGVRDGDRAEIFRTRYLAGETLQQIADDFGITRERVRQILRKTDVPSLGRRPEHCRQAEPLTEAQAKAAALYASGTRPKDIAKITGIREGNIPAALMKAGVERRGQGYWNTLPNDAEITEQVCTLYGQGLSAPEIVVRVPQLKFPETVYRYLKKGGVPTRTRKGNFRGRHSASAAA